ncbi:MAG: GNAT family N-acetyltransferase [Chloroflexi bacterium]|nr:GNAT family N-acetyltransferase [Chloroflexota bacterium]
MLIREATLNDVEAIAKVHVDSWRTTYKGIVPADFLAALSYERRASIWRDSLLKEDRTECVFVAEDERGNVFGFATGGKEREGDPLYTGELYAIYLLQESQQHGAGRKLVAAVAQHLLKQGHAAMLIWVLKENPSRAFYEKLGGVAVREKEIQIGGEVLIEAAYGFTLSKLLC